MRWPPSFCGVQGGALIPALRKVGRRDSTVRELSLAIRTLRRRRLATSPRYFLINALVLQVLLPARAASARCKLRAATSAATAVCLYCDCAAPLQRDGQVKCLWH